MALIQQFLRMDRPVLAKLLQCLGLIGMITTMVEDIRILWASCFLQVMVLNLKDIAHE